jgi:hypothetical protein
MIGDGLLPFGNEAFSLIHKSAVAGTFEYDEVNPRSSAGTPNTW